MTKQEISQSAKDLAWLLWLDTVERLDTLLLEVRHSQTNVIHALRDGSLYGPLQYEEDYLWGEYKTVGADKKIVVKLWKDCLSGATTIDEINEMVAAWIIPYPQFSDLSKPDTFLSWASDICDANTHKETYNAVCTAVASNVRDSHWTADPRRLYYALSALQLLKRNILRDKLILCRWGLRTIDGNDSGRRGDRETMMGRFLLVRSAVMANAHRHIQNLGDLKAQFESALDLGIQDHPKPMTKRRREQGLYSSYLSDRCADLGSLIEDVLIHGEGPSRRQLRGGIYTHRWSHSAVSNSSVMWDEVGIGIFPDRKPRHTDLVNTSFWMPDRPDLQPVIAHEVAHNVIQHAYGDLEPHFLKTSKGSLPRLIRLFSTVLDSFGLTRFPSKDPRHAHDHALGELTCDLLAATVTGPAYLFALVQEIIGAGMDCLFRSPQDEIDFELADTWLDEGWAALNIPSLEWHLRLRLVSAWIKGMGTSDPLATRLCEGVETLCEILLQTIVHLGPRGIHDHVGPWQDMSHVLIQTARKSDALGEVKDWWRMRQDYAKESPFQGGEETHFVGLTLERPTACADLPKDTRLFIQELLIDMKRKNKRPFAEKTLDEAKAGFPGIYGLTWYGKDKGFGQLFEHLHDVPWQSAMLRARDFLHPERGQLIAEEKKGEWLTDMSSDGAPGRELYQIALELFYWHQTSPADPIRTILRLWREKNLIDNFTAATLRSNDKHKSLSDKEIDSDVKQLAQWWTWVSPEEKKRSVEQDSDLHRQAERKISEIAEIAKRYGSRRVVGSDCEKIKNIVREIYPKAILHVHFPGISGLDGISQGASRSFFIRIQMMKLQQLREITAKYTMFDSCAGGSELLAINDHLDCTCHVNKVREAIQSGFLECTDREKQSIRLFLLERCAASRFGVHVAEELEVGPYTLENDPHRYFYHPLMGRYDLFGINCGDLPMRPRMPLFTKPKPPASTEKNLPSTEQNLQSTKLDLQSTEKDLPSTEKDLPSTEQNLQSTEQDLPSTEQNLPLAQRFPPLPPFFVRHELAIGFRLFAANPLPLPDIEKRIPLAFLSVTLNVRTERLDFLHRLKTFYAGEPCQAGDATPRSANGEGGGKAKMTADDLVLLSEGWGDVIIVFQVPAAQGVTEELNYSRRNRLDEIFKLQDRLFSDFMVERTELILTFSSLTYVVSKNTAPNSAQERNDMWPFSIISRVRITKAYGDGSTMTKANDHFVNKMRKFQEKCSDGRAFDVVRTPGRTDFTIYFRCGHFLRNAGFRKELMTAISADADDILTVVSYRESVSNVSPPHSFNCDKKEKEECGTCGAKTDAGG